MFAETNKNYAWTNDVHLILFNDALSFTWLNSNLEVMCEEVILEAFSTRTHIFVAEISKYQHHNWNLQIRSSEQESFPAIQNSVTFDCLDYVPRDCW
jgi:hypothetical protein